MVDDKDRIEVPDDRITPESPDTTESVPKKKPPRFALIGGIAVACVALVALVIGLNFEALSSFASSPALQTTEQKDTPSPAMKSTGDEVEGKTDEDAESGSDDEASDSVTESEPHDSADPSTSSSENGFSGAAAGGSGGVATAPEPEPEPAPSPQPATVTVSISVSSEAVGNPVSGSARPTLAQGATVYDALLATGIPVNATNGPHGVYVQAIGGLAEHDYAGQSGWKYSVNGIVPGTSSGSYVLRDGDSIQWFYFL